MQSRELSGFVAGSDDAGGGFAVAGEGFAVSGGDFAWAGAALDSRRTSAPAGKLLASNAAATAAAVESFRICHVMFVPLRRYGYRVTWYAAHPCEVNTRRLSHTADPRYDLTPWVARKLSQAATASLA